MPDTMHTLHAISLSCQALAMLDPTEPVYMGAARVIGLDAEMKRRGENHVYTCEDIGHMDRHEIDEPCPQDCPTRLAEIAWYLTEHGGLGVITEDDVRAALAAPPESRDDGQRLIADTESDWI